MSLELRVHVAWWFKPYICTLAFFCTLMDREPDWDKFAKVVERGVRVELV